MTVGVLKSRGWRLYLLVSSLLAVVGWIYSRVHSVNPVILGDEYLYSLNSRHAGPWDPSPAGDFSNYLFNLVYSSTNLCGDAFYTCGKMINLFFFFCFLAVIFTIAVKFLNYWAALAFSVAAGLSPLSVYTSMFLPESMFFFMISLVLAAALRAADTYQWKDWALVGVLIGVASLVKPHAWLSALAIGIFLIVLGLTQEKNRYRPLLNAFGAFSLGAVTGRIAIGFLVAGPKAIDFFGIYLGGDVLTTVLQGVPTQDNQSEVIAGSSPMNGVIALFGDQLMIHVLTQIALLVVSIVGLLAGVVELLRTRRASPVTLLALLIIIWLVTLTIEIVIFTGWVTGTGDDHTLRVLARYYDFMFVFVPLGGLSVLASKSIPQTNAWIRLPLATLSIYFLSSATSGFFSNLQIQIADAPNLAGLVVNASVYNTVTVASFFGVLVFAFQPRFTSWVFALLLPASMVATGFMAQHEYHKARGFENAQDKAGKFLNLKLTEEDMERTWIVGNSRFEVTNVALWADSALVRYDVFPHGSAINQAVVPEEVDFILSTGSLSFKGDALEIINGDGYVLYKIK